MLPKKNRADKKAVEGVFKEGIFLNSPTLTFKFTKKNSSTGPRISFIAPKSIAKLAVKRNALRRRGYSALRKHIGRFPAGIEGAFVFKRAEEDISIIENDIQNILSKIN